MILTFVFVNQNAVTVAVKINKMCVKMNKGRGYVVMYRSKKRQVYCKYEDDIPCDGTVVRFSLPLCLLIGKMKYQRRLKKCNNVAKKKDKFIANMLTTYYVTERWYGLAYLRVC